MKNRIIFILWLAIVSGGCNSWLELQPENDLTRDEFWKSKEEVESVLAGGYLGLAENADRLFYWGELRGDLLVEGESPADSHLKMMEFEISETNDLARWDFLYKVINYANEVITYTPGVAGHDPSMNDARVKALQAEGYFLRALSYFWLVRTFKDVPYVVEPSSDDTKDYYVTQADGMEILSSEVAILEKYVKYAPLAFEKEAYSKGRATKGSIYALMADIYLWLEDGQKCVDVCNHLRELQQYTLVASDYWFDMFRSGNSNESVFELQYNINLGTVNKLVEALLFNKGKKLAVNENFVNEFEDTDLRGNMNSFIQNGLRYEIWKIVGLANQGEEAVVLNQRRQAGVDNDNGYIVYRYAEVLLMEAEGQAMIGEYEKARLLMQEVASRVQVDLPDLPDDETAILTYILEMRKKEFAFEGKRWFDLLRIAKRNNFQNKNLLREVIFSKAASVDQARLEAMLRDNNSLYLPVHKDELSANKQLVQNPYYKY